MDREAIEASEQQSWQMLYNEEQRTILKDAAAVLARTGKVPKNTSSADIDKLRKAVYKGKKDFAAVKKLTELLEMK